MKHKISRMILYRTELNAIYLIIISNINIIVFIWSTHSSIVHSILSCQLTFTKLVLKFLIYNICIIKQQVDNLALPYAHDMWKQNICIDDLYLLRINYIHGKQCTFRIIRGNLDHSGHQGWLMQEIALKSSILDLLQ